MELADLEEQIYFALCQNENLIGMLPKTSSGNMPIFHLFAPATDSQKYPLIVYTPLSDTPFLYTDDKETWHKVTIRISIVTNDGQYTEINKIIREIMTDELNFKRVNTAPAVDSEQKKIILNSEYEKIISA